MRKTKLTTKTLAFDALLVALYIVLGFIKIPIGNILRINPALFAVMIGALVFGPVNGLLVGFLGEFLSQILGPYGLTPTTLLWTLPEAMRGLLLGLACRALFRNGLTPRTLMTSKKLPLYLGLCIVVGVLSSLLNTFALYVDSKLFGYYSYFMVFGVLATRLGLAVAVSGILGYVSLIIVSALQRNKIT